MTHARHSAYKDSGIDVLGPIPSHWEVRPLRLLGRLLKGVGGSKEDIVAEGVPCVRYGDLYTTHAEGIEAARTYLTEERARAYTPIQYGDLLFAASGETLEEIGKSAVNLIRGEARCGGDLIVLRPSVPLVPMYLGYAADASPSVAQKTAMGRGTTVKHIYPDELRNLIIAMPPINEQARIADFLYRKTAAVDALIEKEQKLLDMLGEKRATVINKAVTKGLDPGVPMKDSGVPWIGEIPAHWQLRQIKRFARAGWKTFTDGDWIETPYITDEGVRLIQTGNVGTGEYRDKGFRYVSEDTFYALKCVEVEPGDVLICRLDGPVGRACLAPDLGVRMITSVDNAILKTDVRHDPRFLVHLMNLPERLRWLQTLSQVGGGHRWRISRTGLGDLQLPSPPGDEQRAICDWLEREVGRLDRLREPTTRLISRLQEYRQALITAAVTGQLDITSAVAQREPEQLLEAVG